MSLKAKLEAVIYAAEEPVTLAQLTGLFADEALAFNAEQQAAAAAGMAPTRTDALAMPLLSETFAYLEIDQGAEEQAVPAPSEESEVPVTERAGVEAASGETTETSEADSGPAGEGNAAGEVDKAAAAKQEAKRREREARPVIKSILCELIAEYAADGRGIEIREIAGGYRMATKPEFHEIVRSFVKSLKPPLKLSLPALETLAVIAYKQPVTAPEVNEIRGVDSSGVFGSLLARKLITTAGRKPVVGRPILYKTTREFLLRFGLKDVSELPSMEEFEKMAASELEAEEVAANGGAEEFTADPSVEMDEAEAVAPEATADTDAESNPSESGTKGASGDTDTSSSAE